MNEKQKCCTNKIVSVFVSGKLNRFSSTFLVIYWYQIRFPCILRCIKHQKLIRCRLLVSRVKVSRLCLVASVIRRSGCLLDISVLPFLSHNSLEVAHRHPISHFVFLLLIRVERTDDFVRVTHFFDISLFGKQGPHF